MPKQEHCHYCKKKVRAGATNHYRVGGAQLYLCMECKEECVQAWLESVEGYTPKHAPRQ